MLLRAVTRGIAARATLAALRQQHHVSYQQLQVHSLPHLPVVSVAGQQQIPRWFGSAPAESSKPSERDEKHIEADKHYFMALGLPEEIAEVLARRYDSFPLDAEQTAAIENALLQKASELQQKRSSGAGGADEAAPSATKGAADDDDLIKEAPSVAALMALGLPEDVAEILANEDIEYPLLAERIVAIENALLLAAAERDRARKDADAARTEAAAERREKERQTSIVQELRDQLRELEKRLKNAVGHVVNRAILDRNEDRMKYGRGAEAEEKGREDRERERIERWARWVEENPDEAAAMAETAGWRPQDIPREVAALYEALRDYDELGEVEEAASAKDSGSAGAGGSSGGEKNGNKGDEQELGKK